MQELIISTQAGALDANFGEIKAALADILADYKKLVFTEDTKKDAKNAVAELRKDKKALEDSVKEIKKEWMKPFDDFNAKAFELYRLYDEPICYINEQIDAFEEKRKQEKKEHIKAIYAGIVSEQELQEIIPLAKIYNTKWENSTATDKAIKTEILDIKTTVKQGIDTIKNFNSDMEAKAIDMFLRNFNLSEALAFLSNYENEKRAILEREKERARREEIERVRREERAKIEAEQAHAAEVQAAREQAVEALIPATDGTEETYTYMIKLTEDGRHKLEMFMDSVGIEYELLVF